MPDIATNVGPSSGLLPSGPGDPTAETPQTPSPPPANTGAGTGTLPMPIAFYWLAGDPVLCTNCYAHKAG